MSTPYRTRIDTSRMDYGTGPARVANLKTALDEERRAARTSPSDSY